MHDIWRNFPFLPSSSNCLQNCRALIPEANLPEKCNEAFASLVLMWKAFLWSKMKFTCPLMDVRTKRDTSNPTKSSNPPPLVFFGKFLFGRQNIASHSWPFQRVNCKCDKQQARWVEEGEKILKIDQTVTVDTRFTYFIVLGSVQLSKWKGHVPWQNRRVAYWEKAGRKSWGKAPWRLINPNEKLL